MCNGSRFRRGLFVAYLLLQVYQNPDLETWSIQFHVFLFMSICVLEILTLGGKQTNYDKGGVPASRSVNPRLVFIKFVLRGTTCEGRSPLIDPRLNFRYAP